MVESGHPSRLSLVGKMLVTTFGLGLLRPAPGTWGSSPTVVVAGGMILLGLRPAGESAHASLIYHGVLLAILLVFSAVCVAFGGAAEAHYGIKDPSPVVADETAGQAIALMGLSAAATETFNRTACTLAVAFVAFRLCDIAKAWPANGLQRHPGGWGILLDDLAAGVQAAVVVQVVTRAVF